MKELLIVDDNSDHRLILRTMLEAEGYECEEAVDGEGALSMLLTDQVALVLTDLNMPGMNGLQLIDEMQHLTCTRNTPVILLTSQFTEDIPVKAYTSRARAVLSKPYDFSKLLVEVNSAIGQSRTAMLTSIA